VWLPPWLGTLPPPVELSHAPLQPEAHVRVPPPPLLSRPSPWRDAPPPSPPEVAWPPPWSCAPLPPVVLSHVLFQPDALVRDSPSIWLPPPPPWPGTPLPLAALSPLPLWPGAPAHVPPLTWLPPPPPWPGAPFLPAIS